MKILGIGVDMVKISRIGSTLTKIYRKRFLTKVLHKKQIEHLEKDDDEEFQAQYVASRWAAKQATVKAIGKRELVFSQTYLSKDADGKPYIVMEGQDNLELMKELNIDKIHISISHQQEYAVAYALAEAKS